MWRARAVPGISTSNVAGGTGRSTYHRGATLRCCRLAVQSTQHLADDAADCVVELGGDLGDERTECVKHVGAERSVGEVERGDEQGDELQADRDVSWRLLTERVVGEAHLWQLGQGKLLGQVLQEGCERREVDRLVRARRLLVRRNQLGQQEREEALPVQQLRTAIRAQ